MGNIDVDFLIKMLVTIERRTGLSPNEYLEFKNTPGTIEYYKTTFGDVVFCEKKYYGQHGRGLTFTKLGSIHIGQWENGERAVAPYIIVHKDGSFVMRRNFKDDKGKLKYRYDFYHTDGRVDRGIEGFCSD